MVKPGAGSVFSVALLGLVVVGSAASVWVSFPRWEPFVIPGFLLVFVVPAGLPATLVGAIFAISRLDRPPGSGTVGAWLRFGAVTGIVLGVLGSLAWFGPINAWRRTGLWGSARQHRSHRRHLRPADRRRGRRLVLPNLAPSLRL